MAARDPIVATLFQTSAPPAALQICTSGYLLPVRRNAPTFKLSTNPLSGNLASGIILYRSCQGMKMNVCCPCHYSLVPLSCFSILQVWVVYSQEACFEQQRWQLDETTDAARGSGLDGDQWDINAIIQHMSVIEGVGGGRREAWRRPIVQRPSSLLKLECDGGRSWSKQAKDISLTKAEWTAELHFIDTRGRGATRWMHSSTRHFDVIATLTSRPPYLQLRRVKTPSYSRTNHSPSGQIPRTLKTNFRNQSLWDVSASNGANENSFLRQRRLRYREIT